MNALSNSQHRSDSSHYTAPVPGSQASHRTSARARGATRLTFKPLTASIVVLAVVSLAAAAYLFRDRLPTLLHREANSSSEMPAAHKAKSWDGYLTLSTEAQQSLGLATTAVVPQTTPLQLPLLGTTKHDETRITKIRPLFRGRVEKIHVDVGQSVEKGAPVLDLYSADLARAKTDFIIERKQWEYQKKLLDTRQELAKTGAVPKNLLLETENNEARERQEYDIAREKLQLFGLNDDEVNDVDRGQGPEKARLTLRSPAAGVVIRRDVVAGNIYDESDALLTLAPADHLWVWGEVFENDLSLVSLGQKWNIEFPFLKKTISGKVEYISENVDPEIHAVRIRTTVPNPDGKLKADMLVRGSLEIAPESGNVVVPRSAVVVIDGETCAFVKVSGHSDRFGRRKIATVHESDDQVIVKTGLTPDEEVVVTGGLMLQQMYEDATRS